MGCQAWSTAASSDRFSATSSRRSSIVLRSTHVLSLSIGGRALAEACRAGCVLATGGGELIGKQKACQRPCEAPFKLPEFHASLAWRDDPIPRQAERTTGAPGSRCVPSFSIVTSDPASSADGRLRDLFAPPDGYPIRYNEFGDGRTDPGAPTDKHPPTDGRRRAIRPPRTGPVRSSDPQHSRNP